MDEAYMSVVGDPFRPLFLGKKHRQVETHKIDRMEVINTADDSMTSSLMMGQQQLKKAPVKPLSPLTYVKLLWMNLLLMNALWALEMSMYMCS